MLQSLNFCDSTGFHVRHFLSTLTAATLALANQVAAQAIPSSVDPGRVELQQRPTNTLPRRLPEQVARINQNLPDAALAAEAFVLGDFKIVGNTVLSPGQIGLITKALASGNTVTALQVVEATRSLRAAYADAGYSLVVVHRPLYGLNGQRVDVRIEVVEGHVEAVAWPDDAGGAKRQEHWGNRLSSERPLTADIRYRYESLAAELPGLGYNATLVPGSRVGATRLEFGSSPQKPFSLNASANNRGTEASGPWQVSLGAAWLRPTGGNDRLQINYNSTTDWGEQHYLYAQYDTWIGYEGTMLSVYGSLSDGDPGTAVLNQLDYVSEGHTYGFKLTHPLILQPSLDLRLFGGFEHTQFQSNILGTTNSDDRLTFGKLGLDARWSDQWFGENAAASNHVTFTYFQGIEGLGDLGNNNPNASRADGRVDFSKAVLEWRRKHQLRNGWGLSADFKGQAAFTPLLSSQECGFGGSRHGRAYDASALVGDDCAMLGMELTKSIPVASGVVNGLTVFALADYGRVWQDGGADNKGTSIGLGIRGVAFEKVEFSMEGTTASTNAVGIDEDWRVFGSLGVRW